MKRVNRYIFNSLTCSATLALGLAAFPALAQPTNAPARAEFSAFKLITDNNIFNPSRTGRRGRRYDDTNRNGPRASESFALVGVMSYDQTLVAFFDGSPQYRKALKPDDTIAGYKITTIAPDKVSLVAGTNEVILPIAKKELRREDGEWRLADRRATYVADYNRGNSDRERFQRTFNRNPSAVGPSADATNADAALMPDGELPTDLTDQPPEGAAPAAPRPAAGSPTDMLSILRARAAAERGEPPP